MEKPQVKAHAWPEKDMAWAAALTPADLPPYPFEARPGHAITGDRWLTSIQADIAEGPYSPRARTGAIQRDVASLRAVLARHAVAVVEPGGLRLVAEVAA